MICHNRSVVNSLEILDKQIRLYFRACMAVDYYDTSKAHRQSFYSNVKYLDDTITKKLIPAIETMIANDIKYGGEYNINRTKSNGDPVIVIDNACAFCSYRALFEKLQNWLKLQKPTNLTVGGRNVDKIIEDTILVFSDFLKMNVREFDKKYTPPATTIGLDGLMKAFIDEYKANPIYIERKNILEDTVTAVDFDNPSLYLTIMAMRYMCDNYGYSMSTNGNSFYLDNSEVTFHAVCGFKREDDNPLNDFLSTRIVLVFDIPANNSRLKETVLIPPELNKEFGKLIENYIVSDN